MSRVAARRSAAVSEPTVERKIYFYSIEAGQKDGEPLGFDPVPILGPH